MELWEQKQEEATSKLKEAQNIYADEKLEGREKNEQAAPLIEQAKELKTEAAQLKEISTLDAELVKEGKQVEGKEKADSMGFKGVDEYLKAVYAAGSPRHGFRADKRLSRWNDPTESGGDKDELLIMVKNAEGKATMVENIGARGGFLVPTEYRAELLGDEWEKNIIRQRATIIPMRRRQVNIPVLDQTSTTAGVPHQYGGIIAKWTEESASKHQDDPTFRQVELVAHKLVCYTRASDELLEDEAIGLAAFLSSDMGFSGAIRWQEEYTFLRGTGVGMPLGIIPAGATITVGRVADGTVGIQDIFNMLHHFQGENPIWHITRCLMPAIFGLNGPAGNPSYVFISNAREGVSSTLFGYDIHWTEKLPDAGETGDIALCDWKRYLIGDRKGTTIESTNLERFQHDETSWRAVHRVDGQPWLNTPWTTAGGTHTISPFVILGTKTVT